MKHGAGKLIKKRMRRIMKEGFEISQRLPTEQSRKEEVEKLAKALGEVSNAAVAMIEPLNKLKDATSRTKSRKSSN